VIVYGGWRPGAAGQVGGHRLACLAIQHTSTQYAGSSTAIVSLMCLSNWYVGCSVVAVYTLWAAARILLCGVTEDKNFGRLGANALTVAARWTARDLLSTLLPPAQIWAAQRDVMILCERLKCWVADGAVAHRI
jgi:hypothetical protein